jgi:hypothetical protein
MQPDFARHQNHTSVRRINVDEESGMAKKKGALQARAEELEAAIGNLFAGTPPKKKTKKRKAKKKAAKAAKVVKKAKKAKKAVKKAKKATKKKAKKRAKK